MFQCLNLFNHLYYLNFLCDISDIWWLTFQEPPQSRWQKLQQRDRGESATAAPPSHKRSLSPVTMTARTNSGSENLTTPRTHVIIWNAHFHEYSAILEIPTHTHTFFLLKGGEKRERNKWNIFGAPPFYKEGKKCPSFCEEKKTSNGLRITDWVKVNLAFYSLKTRKDSSSY